MLPHLWRGAPQRLDSTNASAGFVFRLCSRYGPLFDAGQSSSIRNGIDDLERVGRAFAETIDPMKDGD
jgi:hypothetical protein